MKKGPYTYLFAFLLTAAVFLPGVCKGQITIFHEAVPTFTEFPANWQSNNGGGEAIFQPATGGYLLVDHIDDWVVTESYDLSLFEIVELTVDIASYGSGENNRLTIEVSIDDGLTWDFQIIETNYTINTNYTTQGPFIIETNSSEVMFRFRRDASTGRGVRFREIFLLGEFHTCGYESFSNLPTNSSGSYLSRTWIGDDGRTWKAEEARTDQTIDGKAITWGTSGTRNLITPEYENGIGILKFSYVRAFTGTGSRSLEIYVNNLLTKELGVSNTSDIVQNFIDTLNISGKVIIEIRSIGAGQVKIDDLTWTCYEKPSCFNTYHYFKTTGSGNWETKNIWQASLDGVNNWVNTSCTPDYRASSILISSGHTIRINDNVSLDNIIIEPGGVLEYRNGILNILDGIQPSIKIEGRFNHHSNLLPKIFGTILVNTNAELSVSLNAAGSSNLYAGNGSSGKVIYEHGSFFVWNTGSFATINQVYFPDVDEATLPIFKVNANPNVGAGSNTTINGVFEAIGNITWQYGGQKTFRNGIIGSGNVTQAASSGQFIISGINAILEGSGILNLNSNGLEISGQVELISDKTITGGPVTLSGTFGGNEHQFFLGGDFEVKESGVLEEYSPTYLVFDGTSDQILKIAAGKILDYVETDKPSGDLFLQTPLNVSQNLTMTHGNIKTNEHLLTIGTSPTQTGELNYSAGTIFGKLRRYFSTDPPTSGVLFPIGASIITDIENNLHTPNHLPALIDYPTVKPTTGGTLTAWFEPESMGEAPDNLIIPETDNCDTFYISSVSYQGFWRFLAEGLSGGEYDITLSPNGYLGIYNLCQLTALKRTGNGPWTEEGTHVEPEGAIASPIIKRTGVTSGFSDWGIGGGIDNPLPIELLSFTAEYKTGKVLLNWATGSEINNDFFTLERSRDAVNTEIIGFVEGAGNSSNTLHYQFVDRDPLPGISYYRLKQTDFDGSFEYSQWVAVEASDIDGRLQAQAISQPQGLLLRIYTSTERPLQILLTDIYGRIVYSEQLSPGSPGQIETFVPMPQAASSVLLYRITDGLDVVTGKVVR